MGIQLVARAFVLNNKDQYLLVKHDKKSPRTLPGGHVDTGETITAALKRELREEFSVRIDIMGMKNHTHDEAIMMHPLPISIHEVQYPKKDEMMHKYEFWYFARLEEVKLKANKEIAEFKWFTYDQIMNLKSGEDIYQSIKDVLDQNVDLLELL